MSNGADSYYTTGLQSDVRAYPTVDDEPTERVRGHHHHSSGGSSHPYQRDHLSISSIIQGARTGDSYAVDLGVTNVSRISRQVRLFLNPQR